MNIRQTVVSLAGVVALAVGMTTGIVSADTGAGSFQVEPDYCDRSDPDNTDVTMSLTQGDLDFGTVQAVGNTIVASSSPLQVRVDAGCAAGEWGIGLHVGPFQSATDEVSPSRLRLTSGRIEFTPDPASVADLERYWIDQGCTVPLRDIAELFSPSWARTVILPPTGGSPSSVIDASILSLLCIPNTPITAVSRGNGVTIATWNAELDLSGLTLVGGGSYESVLTVELGPVF